MSDFSTASNVREKGPARILQMRRAVSGTRQNPTASSPVTQERLRAVDDLLAQELLVISTRRKLLMEIETDLDAGAEIEPGELIYQRELKLVRRKRPDSAVLRPISLQRQ